MPPAPNAFRQQQQQQGNNNNVSTCTSLPVAKPAEVGRRSTSSIEPATVVSPSSVIVLTDDVVSVDEVSFELKRGNCARQTLADV
jgi:hypothetical protein